ncbi:MAG: hypothetical protein ABI445_07700, partial [Polyangia bacterium]
PAATRIASRSTWADLGRQVLESAVAIRILAPTTWRGFPFRLVDVFDVSQTEGRDVAELDLVLDGETPHVAALEAAAARLDIVVTDLWDPHCLGRSRGGVIEIRVGLSQLARTAVLAHELAHEILHQHHEAKKRKPVLTRAVREAEAEATAYIVLRALGLPSTAPAYIAWQGGDGPTILRSLGRIQRAARTILDATQARQPKQVRRAH